LRRFKEVAIQVGPNIARRVALAVTNDGRVSMARYVELCGNLQTAQLLLEKNIFVEDFAGMVGFGNTMLESAIRQDITAAHSDTKDQNPCRVTH